VKAQQDGSEAIVKLADIAKDISKSLTLPMMVTVTAPAAPAAPITPIAPIAPVAPVASVAPIVQPQVIITELGLAVNLLSKHPELSLAQRMDLADFFLDNRNHATIFSNFDEETRKAWLSRKIKELGI
jgi:hypothetical protein